MKVNVLISIARMVEGEYVLIRAIKASTNGDKLHRFLRENELPRTTKMGEADYLIEYGVIENIEIEDLPE